MSTPQKSLVMGTREWMLLLVLSSLWGCSFFFFKVLVAELPPFTVVLGRVGMAALLLNVFLLLRRDPMPTSIRLWGSFAVMGILNNVVPFALIVWSETRISSGLASILNATTPIFTVLAAHVLTQNEKINWNKGIGVLFGFMGVAVLIGPSAIANIGGVDVVGEVACLFAALTYGFAGIYGRRFKGIPPLKVATGQITGSTLVLLPIAVIVDQPWRLPMPSAYAWEAWVGIAILSTALAYMIYFQILAVAGATNLMLVTFLLPISALMLGVFFLGETITAPAIGGMALIGMGLAAIDGRVWTAVRRPRLPPAAKVTARAVPDDNDEI
ncbi:MAG: DMT family transporter [Pseudomonadota bacterium]|nr:DMT family transporter [Pseudomonadota bacterium]